MTVLIDPRTLVKRLAEDPHPVVLDVRWYLGNPRQGPREYDEGHISGARFVDLEARLSSPPGEGGRHPLPSPAAVQSALREVGLNQGDSIVITDQRTSLAAGRLWWMLTDAGVADVQVLDGGMAAWVEAGLATVEGAPSPLPSGNVKVDCGQRPVVDARGAIDALEAGAQLVDVRTPERYSGVLELIDPVAGHIPGAINLPSTNLLRDDGRFLPAEELTQQLSGLRAGDVLYCGSGVTAMQVVLAAESVGIMGLRVYAGSWSDWIRDSRRPIAIGSKPR